MSPLLTGVFASGVSGHLFSGPTGAFDALGSVTVGSGGLSSITFSAIPQTYTHLQIRGISIAPSGGITVRMNGDSGNNYVYHQLYGDGSSALANSGTSQTASYLAYGTQGTTYPTAMVADILDYGNTNKNKTLRSLAGQDGNGAGALTFFSGLWLNQSAVNSLTILGTFSQNSQVSLYGIR